MDNTQYLSEENVLRIIRTIVELDEIRDFWEKKQWHPDADFDFHLHASNLRQDFVRPHIMLLYRNGEPSAMIIGRIQNSPINWKIGYKTIFKSSARTLEIVYGGILGDLSDSNCNILVKELLNCLTRKEADIVLFDHLTIDSPIYRAARRLPNFLIRDYFTFENPHKMLMLPNSFDQFYQQQSRNTKENIRKYQNRIKKKFGDNYSIKCFTNRDEIDHVMNEIEKIAAKTYQRGIGVGFFNTPEYRKKWMLITEKHKLHAFILYLEDQPRAFLTGYLYKKVFYSDTTGFDPEYSYYHPGNFLLMNMIEQFCLDEQVAAIDFGFGDAEYKRKYSNKNWVESCVYIFAPTFKGIRLSIMKLLIVDSSQLTKRVLNRLKMLGWLKKKWRAHLTPRVSYAR